MDDASNGPALETTADGLQLRCPGPNAPGPVRVDFGSAARRHRRRGGHNEALGRALGLKSRPGIHVVDATAGLGRDAFLLADLGFRVTLLEQHPLIYALLEDGLVRAGASDDAWLSGVVGRMTLLHTDSARWLKANPGAADAVYLDPMFPARSKSARVKKEMWLFQQLVGTGDAGEDLLVPALAAANQRVVVKRPAKAPALAGPKPHHHIPGKTVRFDVYNCD